MTRSNAFNDALSERGEAITNLRLTDFHDTGPLFKPAFLGEKWPAVDFFVQLERVNDRSLFFLAQVKTTRGLRDGKLQIVVSRDKVVALTAYPVPTYFIGVDEQTEIAYLVSMGQKRTGFSEMTAAFPMNAENRQRLWKEVHDFWTGRTHPTDSQFVDPKWRNS
jgi:hypothetical protein